MKTTLVIPDAQLKPGDDVSRFTHIGTYAIEHKPDHIVFLGDFGEFLSLSWWDRNRRLKMEMRRYLADIDIMRKALDAFIAPIHELQEKQSRQHVKKYTPRLVWIKGNHEAREYMYCQEHPIHEGDMDHVKRLALKEKYGFTDIVRYLTYIDIEGVLFTHIPFYVIPYGKAVQGKYALARSADLVDQSVVFGHLHRLEYMESFKASIKPRQINILSAGHCMDESARGSGCVVMLKHLPRGLFSYEVITLHELKGLYDSARNV